MASAVSAPYAINRSMQQQGSEWVCHRCGHDIGAVERVGRRDTCLHCGTDLHCCLNCSFYGPSYHNQCREPQAERQVDKQAGNFCEYFSFRTGRPGKAGKGDETRARLDALFAKKK
jgi:hypothetical protein